MQFTMNAAWLLKRLMIVKQVLGRHNSVPMFNHVCFIATKKGLALGAVSGDSVISFPLSASTATKPGLAAVNAVDLIAVLKTIGKNRITVRSGIDGVIVTSESLSVDFPPAPFDEKISWLEFTQKLMDLPFDKSADNITVDAHELLSGPLKRALSSAASYEEGRYYLHGVYLHTEDREVRAVATDGHRMAILSLSARFKGNPKGIIHRDALKVIAALDKIGPGSTRLSFLNDRVRLDNDRCQFIFDLIDGTFPDYRKVVPKRKDAKATLHLDREATLAAIQRVSSAGGISGLKVEAGQDTDRFLALSSMNSLSDIGLTETLETLGPVASIPPFGANPHYLKSILTEIHEEAVEIDIIDSASALTLRGGGSSDSFVLMPLRA